MSKPDARQDASVCRRDLLAWYRRHARDLPWRRTEDPYAIWVSEVMLQQTQIATVIPYFQRFLREFPSLIALAHAPKEKVLTVWSGMGYYRRARNLHNAAKVVRDDFGGTVPRDYERLRELPGVGDYTARALLSIAYNQPYAVLDGNVARVIARLKAWRGNLHQQKFRAKVEAELEGMLSHRQPGRFNQAIMELGQTVCFPHSPRCHVCPLRKACRAFLAGHPEDYPLPRPRRTAEPHYLAAAIIRRGAEVAMVRGIGDGLLTDLWNLPSAFGASQSQAATRLQQKLAALFPGPVFLDGPVATLKHGITYRSIRVGVFPARVSGRHDGNAIRWVPPGRLAKLAVSQLARKIAAKVFRAESHSG